jgi:hypothetical protein
MAIQEGAIKAIIVLTYINPNTGGIMDLSNATTKNLIFKRPNGQLLTKPAEFVTDGTDGKLKYVTVAADDTTPAGAWRVQADVIKPDYQGRSRPGLYFVYRNL